MHTRISGRTQVARAALFSLVGAASTAGLTACGDTTDGAGDTTADPSASVQPGGTAVTPGTTAVTPTAVTPGTTAVTPGTTVDPVDPVDPGTTAVTPGTTVDPGTTTVDPISPMPSQEPVDPTPVNAVSYAADIEPFFVEICSSCHVEAGFGGPNGSDPRAGHDLTMGKGYMFLTTGQSLQADMPLVGDTPETSYLWHKLNGTQESVGGTGAKMPYVGTLSAEQVALVGEWITGGAQP